MPKQYVCSECGNNYNYNKNLRKHVSKAHPNKLSDIAPVKNCNKSYAYKCESCDKQFSYKYNLKHHERQFHGFTSNDTQKKSLKCSLCSFTSTLKTGLHEHFELVHSVQIKSENRAFSSLVSFLQWKGDVEKETVSRYVKQCGSQQGATNSVRHYFVCHRSGYYHPEGAGIRHLKTQGSNKMNAFCPASMQVLESQDGDCNVTFISTHVGHEKDLAHLNLTEPERSRLASDIANKVSFDEILNKVRDSVSDSKLDRLHLLTKKDLYNIETCYNLCSSSVRHSNDGTSVEAWVNEVNSSENPCVLFYKPQDKLNEKHPGLQASDFILILMNSAQQEILKKYGSDCICIDGTHGMNSYGFELFTILVLDDMRQGFPCAFLISNRSDQYAISLFFDYVKEGVGKIKPKVFMSDMADSFFNAWMMSMDEPTMRLYCSWHVDRAWRKNLPKIKGKEKQVEVYKIIRTLMQERDTEAFNTMVPAVMKRLLEDPNTTDFGLYFQENYLKCASSWAYCHRLHSGLNTNMHIERMHRTLKYIYLHAKTVKRLDKAIHALMNFVRDKLFDRLIVLTKGKVTSKLKELRNRHKTALQVKSELVIRDENGWIVPSSSDVKETYLVQVNNSQCKCSLKCEECNACIHQYICTCVDSSIKWNMCKHIHCICLLRKAEATHVDPCGSEANRVSDDEDNLYIHLNEESSSEKDNIIAELAKIECQNSSQVKDQKEKLKIEMLELINGVSTASEIDVVKRHMASLKATLLAVRSTENCKFTGSSHLLQKRNIVPQRRLFSTKKIKNKHSNPMVKPDDTEMESIAISLLHPSRSD